MSGNQFYASCAKSGICSSTSKLEALQQDDIEVKYSQLTSDDIRLVFRSLTQADIPQVKVLFPQLKSMDPISCLQSWMKQDPKGILIALNGRGEIVGSCSGVKTGDGDDGICFGGLFFVLPEYRKQGIGRLLFNLTLQHFGTRNAALNAVPGRIETFQNSGFPIHDTRFTIIEYHSTIWPLDFTFLTDIPPPEISIHPFQASHLPAIFAYDLKLVGFKRTSALALNLLEEDSKTLVAFWSDGTCAGFGTVKVTCAGQVRIGPLYADGPQVADVLMRRLGEMMMEKQMKGFVFVTSSVNRHAMQWMDRLKVGAFEVCDRLYTKKKLDVDFAKIYAQFDVNFSPF